MKWILKAVTQKVISPLPGHEKINHFLQRYITRGYPFREEIFCGYLGVAKQHLANLERFLSPIESFNGTCLEFGSGWDLQMALFNYVAGIVRQTCVDLRPLARLDLVNHNIQRLKKGQQCYEALLGRCFKPLPQFPINSVDDLREKLGIDYRAPVDMRRTLFPDCHFDFISSSKVFEHVPEDQIRPILKECRRILKDDGIMGVDIDMQDHLERVDRTINSYNFLRYSDAGWERLQSLLNYQNRLRLSDYLRFLKGAGFEILHKEVVEGTPRDIESLKKMDLAPRFHNKYSWAELAARVVNLAVRKRDLSAQ